MSDPPPGFGFPFGDDPELFKDAPLFRELQRVMSSSTGPVNWELARQIGIGRTRSPGRTVEATEGEQPWFEEAVRVAELHVAAFTGSSRPRRRAGPRGAPRRVGDGQRREPARRSSSRPRPA